MPSFIQIALQGEEISHNAEKDTGGRTARPDGRTLSLAADADRPRHGNYKNMTCCPCPKLKWRSRL